MLLNNIIDRIKPESKEQRPIILNSLILNAFNQSLHHESMTDKVCCDLNSAIFKTNNKVLSPTVTTMMLFPFSMIKLKRKC